MKWRKERANDCQTRERRRINHHWLIDVNWLKLLCRVGITQLQQGKALNSRVLPLADLIILAQVGKTSHFKATSSELWLNLRIDGITTTRSLSQTKWATSLGATVRSKDSFLNCQLTTKSTKCRYLWRRLISLWKWRSHQTSSASQLYLPTREKARSFSWRRKIKDQEEISLLMRSITLSDRPKEVVRMPAKHNQVWKAPRSRQDPAVWFSLPVRASVALVTLVVGEVGALWSHESKVEHHNYKSTNMR